MKISLQLRIEMSDRAKNINRLQNPDGNFLLEKRRASREKKREEPLGKRKEKKTSIV
jgi:hypothetical protein